MLDEAEQLANEGKWEQAQVKLVEIYKCELVLDGEIKERINNLEARYQNTLIETKTRIIKIAIGSIGTFLLVIEIMFLFINKIIKKFLLTSLIAKNDNN